MEYSVDAAVLDGWNITRLLGEGSYGKVFEIERSEFGQTYRAALKVITVPQSSAEVRSVISEGMSVSQAEAYFHGRSGMRRKWHWNYSAFLKCRSMYPSNGF